MSKFYPLMIISTILSTLVFLTQSLDFHYNGFNQSNLVERGATVIKPSGALRLTNRTLHITGSAFHPTPIPMVDDSFENKTVSSFATHFVFQIVSPGLQRGGYGLAFTISPSPSFPGGMSGHYLGVFDESYKDRNPHVFMVEFDTVNGYNETSDTDSNHVGINVNSVDSRAAKPASYYVSGTQGKEEDVILEKGGPIQAWIEYDGPTKVVNVTVAPLSVSKPPRPLLSEVISDMPEVMLEEMYVGFSASTGRKASSHYILGWSFRLNGTADSLDLSRLPVVPFEKEPPSNAKLKKALIATFSVVLLFSLGFLLIVVLYKRVRRFEVLEDFELDAPHRFRYKDLHKATRGFKDTEKIGTGGFGSVYRGVLPGNGSEVAVKKLRSNNTPDGMRGFAAEIESLGRLRHKHLVNLQGWCKHKANLLLIYEYVPNGSLDSLLYKSKNGDYSFLTWEQRFNIAKGVASALLYLHEEWEQVVIHRDVKSSNVLIDRDMNAKLGDFGLARLYDRDKNSHTTNVVGTIGYIAPELTRTGKASTRTDVFAYGILLLELACGRAPIVYEKDRNVILVDWVVECMQKGSLYDAVDGRLRTSSYVVEEMELVMGLGLLCSHPKEDARPSMRQVMKYLNGYEVFPLFDKLGTGSSSPRRGYEICSRLLALGVNETSSFPYGLSSSSSAGAVSSGSFFSGR